MNSKEKAIELAYGEYWEQVQNQIEIKPKTAIEQNRCYK